MMNMEEDEAEWAADFLNRTKDNFMHFMMGLSSERVAATVLFSHLTFIELQAELFLKCQSEEEKADTLKWVHELKERIRSEYE